MAVAVAVVVVVGVVREAPLAGATDIVTAGGSQRGAASVSRVVVGPSYQSGLREQTEGVHSSCAKLSGIPLRNAVLECRCGLAELA